MTRPLALVLSFLTLAWTPLPTTVSPEIQLAASLPVAETWAGGSAVASDGRGFFVTSVESPLFDTPHQIAMLLDEHGEPALPRSVLLSNNTTGHTAVASSGRNYLAVWDFYGTTLAARFTPAGQRIDQSPIVIRNATSSFQRLRETHVGDPGRVFDVEWNGSQYVVVSEDGHGGFFGALVGEDGRVMRNDLRVSGNSIASRGGVSVTVNNAPFRSKDLVAQTIGPNGEAGGGMTITAGASGADVAAGDDGFLVVYRRSEEIFAQELDAAGNLRGSERHIAKGWGPAVTWSGTHWVVAFTEAYTGDSPLYVVRLGIDATPVKIAEKAFGPALASNGSRVLLTWTPLEKRAVQRVLLDDATITAASLVHRYPGGRSSPALTRIGDVTLAAWVESGSVNPEPRLRVQPVRNGVPLTPQAFPHESLSTVVDFTSNGSEAMLVTASKHSTERIHFFRLAADGTLLSRTTIDQPIPWTTGTARWTGTHYLFIWYAVLNRDTPAQRSEIRALRISAAGEILDSAPVVLPLGDGVPMAVAGERTLVLRPSYFKGYADAIILGPNLTTITVERFDFRAGEGSQFDVATDGVDFLVARVVRSSTQDSILWQRILRDGTIGAKGEAPIAPRSEYSPRLHLFWTGESYLSLIAREDSLFAHRIAFDGVTADPAATRIPYSAGLYYQSLAAQYIGLGRVEIVHPRAGNSEIQPPLVLRTLAPPRRRASR